MNITLIGMAGAGKSYVGEELARRSGLSFIDVDRLMEKKRDRKLKDLVCKLGDEKFVLLEERTVLGLHKLKGHVISPGGSIIYSPKAMKALKKLGPVVFLNVPFRVIKGRIRNINERGLIKFGSRTLKDLYGSRLPLYRKYADVTVTLKKGVKLADAVRKIEQALGISEPEITGKKA